MYGLVLLCTAGVIVTEIVRCYRTISCFAYADRLNYANGGYVYEWIFWFGILLIATGHFIYLERRFGQCVFPLGTHIPVDLQKLLCNTIDNAQNEPLNRQLNHSMANLSVLSLWSLWYLLPFAHWFDLLFCDWKILNEWRNTKRERFNAWDILFDSFFRITVQ